MNTHSSRPMVEGGLLAAVAVLFAVISMYIPILGVLTTLIWPVPLALLGVRHGYKISFMATIVAGLITAMLLNPLKALFIIVGWSLLGIVLGEGVRRQSSALSIMVFTSIASAISIIAVIFVQMTALGIDPLAMHDVQIAQVMEQTLALYRSMGVPLEQLEAWSKELDTITVFMKRALPTGLVLAAIFCAWLNFVVLRLLLKKLGYTIVPFKEFKYWQVPYWTIYIWAGSAGLLFLSTNYQIEWLLVVAFNIQMLISLILSCQGFALFWFWTAKHGWPSLMRNIILALILTNGFLLQIVVFAGAFDLILDLRKLKTNRA